MREAMASVLAQRFRDLELLIIDDGSEDNTEDVVRGFADSRVNSVRLAHSGRLSRVRNAGIARARAELIAFLDSDDLWRGDKLDVQVRAMEERPEAGFCISGYDIFDDAGVRRVKLYPEYGNAGSATTCRIFDRLIRGEVTLCSSSIVVRREMVERVGGLNEELRTGDYEFYTRLAWESPAVIVHEALARVRKHAGNASEAEFSAAGLEEAIFAVERFYALGAIGGDVRDACLTKYRRELAGR